MPADPIDDKGSLALEFAKDEEGSLGVGIESEPVQGMPIVSSSRRDSAPALLVPEPLGGGGGRIVGSGDGGAGHLPGLFAAFAISPSVGA